MVDFDCIAYDDGAPGGIFSEFSHLNPRR